jgi:RNA polymerase sigma factor (sigma-70 family)
MDELIKLVKTYRLTPALDQRLRLAETVFRTIEPDLRFFVCSAVSSPAAEDISQEVLKAIATGLDKFAGRTTSEFWGWCYGIARNKLNDYYRKQTNERLQPMPPEELWQLVEATETDAPLSVADRLDLEYGMQLLKSSKPECYEYLWRHYVFGMAYAEIAAEQNLNYDAVRMKIGRCLDDARALLT